MSVFPLLHWQIASKKGMQNTVEAGTAERSADTLWGNTNRYCIQAHRLVINIKEKNTTLLQTKKRI